SSNAPQSEAGQPFWNYRLEEIERDGKKEWKPVGLSITTVLHNLMETTGGWPKRIGNLLFVIGQDSKPLFLQTADEFFGWFQGFLGGDENLLSWKGGPGQVSRSEFFAFLGQRVEAFEAVEVFPHYPKLPNHFYIHPEIKGGDGETLRHLLKRFCPATPADADLILSYFLQLVWGGAPGQRPAFL